MICEAFAWPDVCYYRIGKAASRTLTGYFHDRAESPEKALHPVPMEFGAECSVRFAVIRHPVARVLSYWADAKHRDMSFDCYVDKIPYLAEVCDPHVTPFSGVEDRVTHLYPLETMDVWWTRMQAVSGMFGERPRRRKGVSSLPKPEPTIAQLDWLTEFYRSDIQLWEQTCKTLP